MIVIESRGPQPLEDWIIVTEFSDERSPDLRLLARCIHSRETWSGERHLLSQFYRDIVERTNHAELRPGQAWRGGSMLRIVEIESDGTRSRRYDLEQQSLDWMPPPPTTNEPLTPVKKALRELAHARRYAKKAWRAYSSASEAERRRDGDAGSSQLWPDVVRGERYVEDAQRNVEREARNAGLPEYAVKALVQS